MSSESWFPLLMNCHENKLSKCLIVYLDTFFYIKVENIRKNKKNTRTIIQMLVITEVEIDARMMPGFVSIHVYQVLQYF